MVEDIEPPLADGRYRLLAVLGVGGMSKVYRAYDALMEEFIAIKVLNPELALRPNIRERFLSELRTKIFPGNDAWHLTLNRLLDLVDHCVHIDLGVLHAALRRRRWPPRRRSRKRRRWARCKLATSERRDKSEVQPRAYDFFALLDHIAHVHRSKQRLQRLQFRQRRQQYVTKPQATATADL